RPSAYRWPECKCGGYLTCVHARTRRGSDPPKAANPISSHVMEEQRSRRHLGDSTDPHGTFLGPLLSPDPCSFPQSAGHSREPSPCRPSARILFPARPEAISPGSRHSSLRFRPRSEEHTSELQSRFDLVCRLLLEKKKIT